MRAARRNPLVLASAAIAIFGAPLLCAAQTAPAKPDPVIDDIAARVLACQVPQGGIARTPAERRAARTFLTSYSFGGLALAEAYGVTRKPKYADGCRRFVEFWTSHQNAAPDRFGVAGTMYDQDYVADTGRVEDHAYDAAAGPNANGPGYDAADADPPMIAVTAWRYYQATDDIALLRRHAAGWDLIAGAMTALLDADGLTWAHPRYKMKYLMDASEVYAGFVALRNISDACGDRAKSARYADLAARVRAGIASLWSASADDYDWAKDAAGNRQPCDWTKVYPDAVEQLWPALWQAEPADSPRTSKMWQSFKAHRPRWATGDDEFLAWPAAAAVALRLDDPTAARAQTRRILDQRSSRDDWEVNQMYFTLLTCTQDEGVHRSAISPDHR